MFAEDYHPHAPRHVLDMSLYWAHHTIYRGKMRAVATQDIRQPKFETQQPKVSGSRCYRADIVVTSVAPDLLSLQPSLCVLVCICCTVYCSNFVDGWLSQLCSVYKLPVSHSLSPHATHSVYPKSDHLSTLCHSISSNASHLLFEWGDNTCALFVASKS